MSNVFGIVNFVAALSLLAVLSEKYKRKNMPDKHKLKRFIPYSSEWVLWILFLD